MAPVVAPTVSVPGQVQQRLCALRVERQRGQHVRDQVQQGVNGWVQLHVLEQVPVFQFALPQQARQAQGFLLLLEALLATHSLLQGLCYAGR